MVSKIAVMALVAVVAVPILLGYGLNINTENKQVWVENNDPLNAKDYLLTTFDATGATYTDADIYQMNSNSFYRNTVPGYAVPIKFYPWYQSTTTTNTPIKLYRQLITGSFSLNGPYYGQYIVPGKYDAANYYNMVSYRNGAALLTYYHVKEVVYNGTDLYVTTIDNNGYGHVYSSQDVTQINMTATGTVQAYVTYDPGSGWYSDVSKGYRLNLDGAVWNPANITIPSNVYYTYMDVSESTKSMLITLDLSTITDSDAVFTIYDGQGTVYFKKTTTAGVVKWEYSSTIIELSGEPIDFEELYYNPLSSSNTYQLYINADYTGELRYIGGWTDIIGPAESMITYSFEISHNPNLTPSEHINALRLGGQSPVMRIDAAKVGAYDYRVMEDAVYDPAAFRANPITTLTKGLRFGHSLEFGGNTYQVTKGNITIGTHDFSLEGMTFESVQVGGQYENRINGNTVSTTATPSTITFNGKWLTDVTSKSQSMETVSDTKWEPGKFAWNGIDTDFKIAGLMASLGAFIALAVYGRRSGAKVLPLLVVCGGAALMFLVMI